MNIKGQGHPLTFVQSHSDLTFSNVFSLETAMPIEAKFHVEPSWYGGIKINTNGICHMTNMAAMPIYGKTFKNLLLWIQKVNDVETWYGVLGIQVLPSLIKWCPWVYLDLIYG